jgi:DNA-binding beta-propeller fold protein YncE
MFTSYATNVQARDHGLDGDIVFDTSGLVYSISTIGNGLISILKQNSVGVKQLETRYGTVTGALPVTRIAEARYSAFDGENIYVTGSSKGTSLTGNSATFNIFLHKAKVSDLTTVFTRHWGLDGLNQDDFAHGMAINPDGGKILITG